MALCEFCGVDVAPIDVFEHEEKSEMHWFCSQEHFNRWNEARAAAGAAAKKEPESVEEHPSPPAKLSRPRKRSSAGPKG